MFDRIAVQVRPDPSGLSDRYTIRLIKFGLSVFQRVARSISVSVLTAVGGLSARSAVLINKRYDSFQFLPVELIGELLLVLVVDRVGARHKVAAREPEEQQSRERPSEQREA